MARDDYFVIVYKLLTILYTALKHGKTISEEQLKELNSTLNGSYWFYILNNLYEESYITGIKPVETLTGKDIKFINIQITPKGIEYLQSNSMMNKAKSFLSKVPEWLELLMQFH